MVQWSGAIDATVERMRETTEAMGCGRDDAAVCRDDGEQCGDDDDDGGNRDGEVECHDVDVRRTMEQWS